MKLFLTGFGRLRMRNRSAAPGLLRLAQKVCSRVPKLRGPGEINFILVPDDKIKKLHKDFLDDPTRTDVITFQYPLQKTGRKGRGDIMDEPFGDVYISIDTARSQAAQAGHPLLNEVSFLMVHGLLHLAGYDDHNPAERRRMLAKQARLIRAISPQLAPADVFAAAGRSKHSD